MLHCCVGATPPISQSKSSLQQSVTSKFRARERESLKPKIKTWREDMFFVQFGKKQISQSTLATRS